jgi:hypothetical protein
VKQKIFGLNMARIHGLDLNDLGKHNVNWKDDKLAKAKAGYVKEGGERSNAFYGFIDKKDVSFKRT